MATIGLKRKRLCYLQSMECGRCSPPPSSASPQRRHADADLESSEGSCQSLISDSDSGPTQEDDVEVVARALTDIAVNSPEALRPFMHRLTPIVVVRSIDWDLLPSKLSKMAGRQCRWTEGELRAFLEICLEEIAARNITSSCPKAQAYVNMQRKMLERAGKQCNKAQLKYCWENSRKRFTLSMFFAGNIFRGLRTRSKSMMDTRDKDLDMFRPSGEKKRGARAFRASPLRCIPEHHAVFRGRLVVGNHSAVAEQQSTGATTIDVPNLAELAAAAPPSSGRGKGKRPANSLENSGGSKKTRSDSAEDAIHRLVELRLQSNESRACREEETRAKSSKACIDLVVAYGYHKGSKVWFMAVQLFRDPYWRHFFIDDCPTAEERLRFIEINYPTMQGGSMGAGMPPPTCGGGGNGYGNWFGGPGEGFGGGFGGAGGGYRSDLGGDGMDGGAMY